jgi:hypothetical protein
VADSNGDGDCESDREGLEDGDAAIAMKSVDNVGAEGADDAGILGTLCAAGEAVRLTVSATPPPTTQMPPAMPR